MEKTSNESKKQYFYESVKMFLKPNETVENVPAQLSELKKAYEVREEHIKKLYQEIKDIKRLSF